MIVVPKSCMGGITRCATAPSQPMRGNLSILRSGIFGTLASARVHNFIHLGFQE